MKYFLMIVVCLLVSYNLSAVDTTKISYTNTEIDTEIGELAFRDSSNIAVPQNGVDRLYISGDGSATKKTMNIVQNATSYLDSSLATGTDLTNSNTWEAFKFTAPTTGAIGSFSVQIKKSGTVSNSTAYYTGYVYSDNAGVPNTAVSTVYTYTYFGNLTTSFVEYSFNVAATSLTAGTAYWLVLKRNAAPTGGGTIIFNSKNVGTGKHTYSSDGTTWATATDTSAWLKIYNQTYDAIYGQSETYNGVFGYSRNSYGIRGTSVNDAGGIFNSTNNIAISATSTYNIGIIGTGNNSTGVEGISTGGYGVIGQGGVAGVYGTATGTGYGGQFDAVDSTKYAIYSTTGKNYFGSYIEAKRDIDMTSVTSSRFKLPISGSVPATPTLSFGDGDSGFYENTDDDLRIGFSGNASWQWSRSYFGSNEYSGAIVLNGNTTSTVPSLIPHNGDLNTGIGSASASDSLSIISGGVERINISNTGISFPTMGTDSTACVTGQFWFNSTTGAIHRKF